MDVVNLTLSLSQKGPIGMLASLALLSCYIQIEGGGGDSLRPFSQPWPMGTNLSWPP